MHFNLEEQEQLAELKAWWKQYGKWLLVIAVILALSYSGYVSWNWWQNRQAVTASKLYETLLQSAVKQDLPTTLRAAEDLQKQYSGTAYAGMAGLVTAQLANAAGDLGAAQKQLRWTMESAKSDAHRDLARSRLISILIDQGDFANAEKLADQSASKAFAPLMLERKGDVYLAQDRQDQAREQYQKAWDLLSKNAEAADEAKRLLRIKLEAVGGRS